MLNGLSLAYSYTWSFIWSPGRVVGNSIWFSSRRSAYRKTDGRCSHFLSSGTLIYPHNTLNWTLVWLHTSSPLTPAASEKVFLTQVSGSSEEIDFWTAERYTWDRLRCFLWSFIVSVFYCGCDCVLCHFLNCSN